MGIATFPSVSSPIKSIQRGEAVAAGNITITTVDITKTMVNSFSTSAAGTVAASGTINAATGSTSATSTSGMSGNLNYTYSSAVYYFNPVGTANYNVNARYGTTPGPYPAATANFGTTSNNGMNVNGANVSLNATNISGGSTNLVSANYGVYLSSSTNLVATGPCRYEVVEYY